MKMVRSLLLTSAAGLVAVGGAQAADLPVKAAPVQYVKICTLYGDGYYYIPGSDTCIKFGGYIRADYGYNVRGGRTPQYSGVDGAQDRTVAPYSTRHRANLQVDTRTQTPYGTLRTFTSLHFQGQDLVLSFNVARAFIQWAGFTFGRAQSFQDTWGITDSWHYTQQQNNSDTGANGVNQIAYTWDLGNGMTFTLGADDNRRVVVTDLSNQAAVILGNDPEDSYGFNVMRFPDAYAAFKINQAWGYWATSFVVHDVNASYNNWDGPVVGPATGCAGPAPSGADTPLSICGYPSDKVGWAIQTGAEFKLDFITPGDRFGFNVRYAQGASAFGGGSNLVSPNLFGHGNVLAFGSLTDAVFVNGSGFELTTSWTVGAGYEHYWAPQLKTSFYGAYTQIRYNDTASDFMAANICGAVRTNTDVSNISPNCSPDWAFFMGGSRTQWSPAPGFIMGVDLVYTRVFTAFDGSTVWLGPNNSAVLGGRPPSSEVGRYRFEDQGVFSAVFRAQRNFNAGD